MEISFTRTVQGVDWVALTTALREDDFDNGRTPEQLRDSFVNSYGVCFAWANGKVIGKARVLSDGVCNAYMVDVWTHSAYRNQGVAREMIALLKHDLQGQHLYLQADDDVVPFYIKLGFQQQPNGMSCVIGQWLKSEEGAKVETDVMTKRWQSRMRRRFEGVCSLMTALFLMVIWWFLEQRDQAFLSFDFLCIRLYCLTSPLLIIGLLYRGLTLLANPTTRRAKWLLLSLSLIIFGIEAWFCLKLVASNPWYLT